MLTGPTSLLSSVLGAGVMRVPAKFVPLAVNKLPDSATINKTKT